MSDPDEMFLIQTPAWFIVNKDEHQKRGIPYSIAQTFCPEYGAFLAVFTDVKLAERFLSSLAEGRVTKYSLLEITTRTGVAVIAEDFEKAGCEYVAIDITPGPTLLERFHPIRTFLDDCARDAALDE